MQSTVSTQNLGSDHSARHHQQPPPQDSQPQLAAFDQVANSRDPDALYESASIVSSATDDAVVPVAGDAPPGLCLEITGRAYPQRQRKLPAFFHNQKFEPCRESGARSKVDKSTKQRQHATVRGTAAHSGTRSARHRKRVDIDGAKPDADTKLPAVDARANPGIDTVDA